MATVPQTAQPLDVVAVALLMAERLVDGVPDTGTTYNDTFHALKVDPQKNPKQSDYAVARAELINRIAVKLLSGLVPPSP